MSKRGRPAYADPPVEFKIYIPSSIAARVKLECYNPLRDNIRYGAQSAIVAQALQEYFNRKDAKHDPSPAMDGHELDNRGPQENQTRSETLLPTTTSPVESATGNQGA